MAGAAGAQMDQRTLEPAGSPIRLPGPLAEVSGLAPAHETSVYAHNDEQATIYEVDIGSGKILRAHDLGRPAAAGDFEAMALSGAEAALMTSDGALYVTDVTARRRSLRYRTVDTRPGPDCEIEGLAPADARGAYFAACKHSGRRLVIRRWSAATGYTKAINLKLDKAVPNAKDFRATDIVNDPEAGTLLVLDSAAGAILEVTYQGRPAAYWRLGGDHPQAEGLAMLRDGRRVVADEVRSSDGTLGGGTLTIYPPRR